MSDYEDDDEASYFNETDTEAEINEDEDWIGNEANGHGLKDEEDVHEEKIEEENYGEEEPIEHEDDGLRADVDDLMEEEEVQEEKKDKMVIIKNKRKTSPLMTKYEFSYLVSQRAMAIENGSPLMIPDTELIHSIDIAKEETLKGVNPIIIQRVLPNDIIEEWKCGELMVPFAYIENMDFIDKFM
jgi:DNA-directed RNA polymerase subunit K/omega